MRDSEAAARHWSVRIPVIAGQPHISSIAAACRKGQSSRQLAEFSPRHPFLWGSPRTHSLHGDLSSLKSRDDAEADFSFVWENVPHGVIPILRAQPWVYINIFSMSPGSCLKPGRHWPPKTCSFFPKMCVRGCYGLNCIPQKRHARVLMPRMWRYL